MKKKRLNDLDILGRVIAGTLIVVEEDGQEPIVKSYHPTRKCWVTLRTIERQGTKNGHGYYIPNGTVYRFVQICLNGHVKKKIALHRLVWIYHNRMLPPAGYDVDHWKTRSDRYENLRLLKSEINRATSSYGVSEETEELPF